MLFIFMSLISFSIRASSIVCPVTGSCSCIFVPLRCIAFPLTRKRPSFTSEVRKPVFEDMLSSTLPRLSARVMTRVYRYGDSADHGFTPGISALSSTTARLSNACTSLVSANIFVSPSYNPASSRVSTGRLPVPASSTLRFSRPSL